MTERMERFVLCAENAVIFGARAHTRFLPSRTGPLYDSIFIFTEQAPCYQIDFKLKRERVEERRKKRKAATSQV